ncbi:MAG: hypothetical protein QM570_13685 [Planctomycetota bacterium]|nr:hypothetical protein [Planctomycetota bacterium]
MKSLAKLGPHAIEVIHWIEHILVIPPGDHMNLVGVDLAGIDQIALGVVRTGNDTTTMPREMQEIFHIGLLVQVLLGIYGKHGIMQRDNRSVGTMNGTEIVWNVQQVISRQDFHTGQGRPDPVESMPPRQRQIMSGRFEIISLQAIPAQPLTEEMQFDRQAVQGLQGANQL